MFIKRWSPQVMKFSTPLITMVDGPEMRFRRLPARIA
jgi:hypothetical protein